MPIVNTKVNAKEITLRRWRVIEAEAEDGTRTRHVWGHDVSNNVGRASSPITEFDLETMTATTRSGSKYKLFGLPGNSRLGKQAWNNRRNINIIISEQDITDEYLNVNQLSTARFAKINIAASHPDEQ